MFSPVMDACIITWISLRDWATSFNMPSLSLSWQLIISFSRANSLSITDGSEGLKETNKLTPRKSEQNGGQDVQGLWNTLRSQKLVTNYWDSSHIQTSATINRWQKNHVCVSPKDPSRHSSCSQWERREAQAKILAHTTLRLLHWYFWLCLIKPAELICVSITSSTMWCLTRDGLRHEWGKRAPGPLPSRL